MELQNPVSAVMMGSNTSNRYADEFDEWFLKQRAAANRDVFFLDNVDENIRIKDDNKELGPVSENLAPRFWSMSYADELYKCLDSLIVQLLQQPEALSSDDEEKVNLYRRIIWDPVIQEPRLRVITTQSQFRWTSHYVTRAFRRTGLTAVVASTSSSSAIASEVFLQAKPGRQMGSICRPDVAIWGRHKCSLDTDSEDKSITRLVPLHLDKRPRTSRSDGRTSFSRKRVLKAPPLPYVNPDVVIQFCWGEDSEAYHEEAINGMMNRAIVRYVPNQPYNEAPTLGFLIRFTGASDGTNNHRPASERWSRVDVYRVPQGTSVEDARNQKRGARHDSYVRSGNDVVITITAEELRSTGLFVWLGWVPPLNLSIQSLVAKVEQRLHEEDRDVQLSNAFVARY